MTETFENEPQSDTSENTSFVESSSQISSEFEVISQPICNKRKRKFNAMMCCYNSTCILTRPFKINPIELEHRSLLITESKTRKIANWESKQKKIVPNKTFEGLSRRASAREEIKGIYCFSCAAKTTPYWQDGWADTVFLCNKCGLRLKKNYIVCKSCCYVPNKKERMGQKCPRCKNVWTKE